MSMPSSLPAPPSERQLPSSESAATAYCELDQHVRWAVERLLRRPLPGDARWVIERLEAIRAELEAEVSP